MFKNKAVRGKKQEKMAVSQKVLAVAALGAIGLSAVGNVSFWTSMSTNDFSFWFNGVGSAISDLAKPGLMAIIPAFWVAGRRAVASVLSFGLGIAVMLSLTAAYGIKAQEQAKLTAQAAKASAHRARVQSDYDKAKSKAPLGVSFVPVSTLKDRLATAQGNVAPKIWKRTSSCTDATKKSSINACAAVVALRSEIKRSTQVEAGLKRWNAARQQLNALPALAKPTLPAFFINSIFIGFSLFIEIFSTIGLYAAFERPTRKTEKKQIELVQEVKWIEAMKKAAKNPGKEKIYFDDQGLLKAPYTALRDVFDVKSVSSVKSRLNTLAEAGKLETIGEGRNVKYRVLENA